MTEQEKSSAVVEETRETVEIAPQPETTEKIVEKKNGNNKTSLALSAIAIAIALAAAIVLLGIILYSTCRIEQYPDITPPVSKFRRPIPVPMPKP